MNGGSPTDCTVNPTMSNMLNKSVFLASNTIIRQDGKVHSYCGLRLADIHASDADLKQTETSSASKYAHTRLRRRAAGVLAIYHNLGPPSYECFKCNATMWYNERSDKARKAVTLTFSLCCQEGRGPYTFRINGQNYHRMGSLLPAKGIPLRGDTSAAGLAKRIVLPQTFIGSPRYMMQNYKDAMALCRAYGNPNLFITFTLNPKWPEIGEMLAYVPGQKSHDRPEVGTCEIL
ncbi:ATP-dependent DNA helicase PIF1-like protein [Tanacetum coccineum]